MIVEFLTIVFLCLFDFLYWISFRSTDGRYLGATKNGAFRLLDDNKDTATQWEY